MTPVFATLRTLWHYCYRWFVATDRPTLSLSEIHTELLTQPFFAHAVATPLTTLLVNIQLALENEQRQQKKEHLATALTAAQRLKQVLQLHTSNLKQCALTTFDLKQAIEEVVMIAKRKSQRTPIYTDLAEIETSTYTGNRLLFQEALLCAINNALDACSCDTASSEITLSGSTDDHYLRLFIQDTGSGMSFLTQQWAFIRGLTTKRSGTGLGLYFIKQVVEKIHAGHISIHSAFGKGTLMTWELPRQPDTQNLVPSRSFDHISPMPFASA